MGPFTISSDSSVQAAVHSSGFPGIFTVAGKEHGCGSETDPCHTPMSIPHQLNDVGQVTWYL